MQGEKIRVSFVFRLAIKADQQILWRSVTIFPQERIDRSVRAFISDGL